MASNTVIVFGPTGGVGSHAAIAAQAQGAKVVLAMRDPKKSIPGLTSEKESSGGYERVQADLTDADSVGAAVTKTGAKSAFIYLAMTSQDHMKSTLQALKDAGVGFVVFLSSYTLGTTSESVESIPPSDIIPWLHAQVELNLEQTFGPENWVAVRPGGFATNVMHWHQGLKEGNVKLYGPECKFDYITPIDMGTVSGTILAKGAQQNGEKYVPLFGPKMTSQQQAVEIISEVSGRDIKATPVDYEGGVEVYKSIGMPEHFARYLADMMGKVGDGVAADHPELYKQGVANIEKYTGKPATGFKEWAETNKYLFGA